MIEFLQKWYHKNLSSPQAALLLIQLVVIYLLVYYCSSIIGPLIAALVLAFISERPVSFLVKRGASRLSATAVTMLSYIGIVVSILIVIVPPAIEQFSNISGTITKALSTTEVSENTTTSQTSPINVDNDIIVIEEKANNLTIELKNNNQNEDKDDNTDVNTSISSSDTNRNLALNNVQNSDILKENTNNLETSENIEDTNSTEIKNEKKTTTKIEQWIISKYHEYIPKLPQAYQNIVSEEQINSFISTIKESLKNWLSPFLTTQVAPLIKETLSSIVYLVIVPIFTFYMLKDKEKFLEFGKKYLAPYEEIRTFWAQINKQIAQYLSGNLLHIAISSCINVLAFWLFNLNYALILGIGVGLSVIIPYIGGVLITIPLLVVAFIQYGFSSAIIWLMLIYLIIQVIDAYVLTPFLFSETLNLDAFAILVSILIFGAIWGFWGVVLAIPLATSIKTAFQLWPQRK